MDAEEDSHVVLSSTFHTSVRLSAVLQLSVADRSAGVDTVIAPQLSACKPPQCLSVRRQTPSPNILP